MIGLVHLEKGIGSVIEDKTKAGVVIGNIILERKLPAGNGQETVGLALEIVLDDLAVANTPHEDPAGECLAWVPGGIGVEFTQTGRAISNAAILDSEFLAVDGLNALGIAADLQIPEGDFLQVVQADGDTRPAVSDQAGTTAVHGDAGFRNDDSIGQEVGARFQANIFGDDHLVGGLNCFHSLCLSECDYLLSVSSRIGSAEWIIARFIVGMGLSKCAACSGQAGR